MLDQLWIRLFTVWAGLSTHVQRYRHFPHLVLLLPRHLVVLPSHLVLLPSLWHLLLHHRPRLHIRYVIVMIRCVTVEHQEATCYEACRLIGLLYAVISGFTCVPYSLNLSLLACILISVNVFMSVALCVYLTFSLSVCLPVCLSVFVSLLISVSLSPSLSYYVMTYLLTSCLLTYLLIYWPICFLLCEDSSIYSPSSDSSTICEADEGVHGFSEGHPVQCVLRELICRL